MRAFVAAMILPCALACEARNSTREEARALLERISAVDLRAPLERRQRQVEALATLPLAEPDLIEVRDACGKAHRGLLAAERTQATARAELDRLDAAGQREEAQLAAVARQLAAAARELQAAQAALPTCEAHARELAVRRR